MKRKNWREWEIKEIEVSDEALHSCQRNGQAQGKAGKENQSLNDIHHSDIGMSCSGRPKFPERLRAVKPEIKKLYYRGEWSESIFDNCLAVVGTRKMTRYGEGVVEKLLPGVVQAGVTIVSGFMYGVDSKAHEICLEYGGRTIAVLGCGLNQLTPASNDKLYTEILEGGGLVISEYEPEEKAQRWMFPQRNRIVAGLSQACLVIEGGEKSGTLITARLAKEMGRTVLAVPGPVGSSQSAATNSLIQGGARLVTSGEDVLGSIRPLKFAKNQLGRGYSPSAAINKNSLEGKIVEELKREEMEMDELARVLKIGVVELSGKLSELQLSGVVEERLGKYSISNANKSLVRGVSRIEGD